MVRILVHAETRDSHVQRAAVVVSDLIRESGHTLESARWMEGAGYQLPPHDAVVVVSPARRPSWVRVWTLPTAKLIGEVETPPDWGAALTSQGLTNAPSEAPTTPDWRTLQQDLRRALDAVIEAKPPPSTEQFVPDESGIYPIPQGHRFGVTRS